MAGREDFPVYPGWETVQRIGSGSFGAVYEIRRNLFGTVEKAALKQISIPQDEGDVQELYSSGYDDASITAHYESYLADIVKEYQLMAEMKGHTNVVYCDDIRYIQKDKGIGWDIYIKMELLTPLMKALEKAADEERIVKLGKDLSSALVLCRSRNIIHRDIKPQNIFISKDGDFKLGDFGIAKTAEKTSGGTKIGTYNYMAPEVYNNQPYGHGADLYSLGLVLYWLLNNRRLPFYPAPPAVPKTSDMEQARIRRFRGEPIPAPAHGSEALKRIVLKACAFDPRDRYQRAEDLLRDLEALPALPAEQDEEADGPMTEPTATMHPTGREALRWGDIGSAHMETERLYEEEAPVPGVSFREQSAATYGQTASPGQGSRQGEKTKKLLLAAAAAALLLVIVVVLAVTLGGGQEVPYPNAADPVTTIVPVTLEPELTETEAPDAAPTGEPDPEATPAATESPADTTAEKGPCADDLRALQNDPAYPNNIVFPKEQSYLAAYETMYVKSYLGNSIYLYWDASGDPSHKRSYSVFEKTEVRVLARENGYSCIVFTSDDGHPVSGWVASENLVDSYA
jgi:serine/threonine protein kinase